jgi:cellulose biosynthesis protein BcsQ
MIAITGAKGGCGKTTTTLGLAEEFARRGTPTLIVDADRQLPNLHVAADVDRKPTIASVSEGDTLTEFAHQYPANDNIRVLPAPTSEESVDMQSKLTELKTDSIRILVDCPAGVGPDAVDPLVVADHAIVVTRNTKQSYEAAQKTIDTAQRLNLPIAGVMVNQCDEFPGNIPLEGEFPLVQPVPTYSSQAPHRNPTAREAYNAIVDEFTDNRLPTGIPAIDTRTDGVPSGSIIGVSAKPDARSEQLLYALASTDRQTTYITTERSEQIILNQLRESDIASLSPQPIIKQVNGPDVLEQVELLIESLPKNSNLIIDSMDRLEQTDREAYVSFMNTLSQEVYNAGAIAMVHMIERSSPSRNRSTTTQFLDLELALERIEEDGSVVRQISTPISRSPELPEMTATSELF